jgi:hypothetical protein
MNFTKHCSGVFLLMILLNNFLRASHQSEPATAKQSAVYSFFAGIPQFAHDLIAKKQAAEKALAIKDEMFDIYQKHLGNKVPLHIYNQLYKEMVVNGCCDEIFQAYQDDKESIVSAFGGLIQEKVFEHQEREKMTRNLLGTIHKDLRPVAEEIIKRVDKSDEFIMAELLCVACKVWPDLPVAKNKMTLDDKSDFVCAIYNELAEIFNEIKPRNICFNNHYQEYLGAYIAVIEECIKNKDFYNFGSKTWLTLRQPAHEKIQVLFKEKALALVVSQETWNRDMISDTRMYELGKQSANFGCILPATFQQQLSNIKGIGQDLGRMHAKLLQKFKIEFDMIIAQHEEFQNRDQMLHEFEDDVKKISNSDEFFQYQIACCRDKTKQIVQMRSQELALLKQKAIDDVQEALQKQYNRQEQETLLNKLIIQRQGAQEQGLLAHAVQLKKIQNIEQKELPATMLQEKNNNASRLKMFQIWQALFVQKNNARKLEQKKLKDERKKKSEKVAEKVILPAVSKLKPEASSVAEVRLVPGATLSSKPKIVKKVLQSEPKKSKIVAKFSTPAHIDPAVVEAVPAQLPLAAPVIEQVMPAPILPTVVSVRQHDPYGSQVSSLGVSDESDDEGHQPQNDDASNDYVYEHDAYGYLWASDAAGQSFWFDSASESWIKYAPEPVVPPSYAQTLANPIHPMAPILVQHRSLRN